MLTLPLYTVASASSPRPRRPSFHQRSFVKGLLLPVVRGLKRIVITHDMEGRGELIGDTSGALESSLTETSMSVISTVYSCHPRITRSHLTPAPIRSSTLWQHHTHYIPHLPSPLSCPIPRNTSTNQSCKSYTAIKTPPVTVSKAIYPVSLLDT